MNKAIFLDLIAPVATPAFYFKLVNTVNRVSSVKRKPNVAYVLRLLARRGDLFFVHIGANDGVKNDPLYGFTRKHHWRGILVEPLPDFFERLKSNYSDEPQLIFENVGIGEEEGELDFYFLPKQFDSPDWLQQIGSFDRKAIEFNLASLPDLIKEIVSRKIKVVTFESLLAKHAVSRVDLLVIDAEGFEYKILSRLPSWRVKPQNILFERGSMQPESLQKLEALLTAEGYFLQRCGGDTFAMRRS